MAIEFLIHRDCPVKEELPIGNIVTRIKLMASAHATIQQLPEGGTQEDIRAATFTYTLYGPDGEERNSRFTVGQALDLGEELARLGKGCEQCPIAGTGAFRCYGSISYPITASAEQWLCSLCTTAIEKGGTHASVVERIPGIGLTGAPFEAMRKDGSGTYFESREPATVTIRKNMFAKETITSSQLLELLFGTSPLEGRHIMLLLILAGADPTGEPPDANHSLPPVPEQDDARIGEFIAFFESLSSAFLLNASVGVDY